MYTADTRLSRIEENLYFLEQRLEALDSALCGQQIQLDSLEKQLTDALRLLRQLREKLEESPENSLPPHFMPERY